MSASVKTKVPLPLEKIAAICRKWKITRLEVFGSVLRDDFDPERSDIDFLATFGPDADVSFFTLDDMEEELAAAVGRDVDLVLRRQIERSKNPFRKNEILSTARPIYEAA